MQPVFFRVSFVELRHFDKHFIKKKTRKKGPTGKHCSFFSYIKLKLHFWMENLTQRWTQSGPFFFPKSEHLFRFSKKGRGSLPLQPYCMSLNVGEYASISLNISNILENAWINCSNYARALNMLDHLTCLTDFWRCLES